MHEIRRKPYLSNEYVLDIIGALHQTESKKQINVDIKQLEKVINMLRLTGTFAKGDTKKELNAYIKSLQSQLAHIKLAAKIDSRNLKSEVDKVLRNVSFKDIDAFNIDENKAKLKIRKVIADAKAYVEKTPITVNIESKKAKLGNDLTTYLNRNTKINESSVLLEEAEKVRELINVINDKKTLREATDAFQLYKSEVSATGFNTKSTTDKIKGMLGHVSKVSSALGIASMAVNNFARSLKALKSNDTILVEISKTSEMTKKQLQELGDEAFRTASKYGQLSSGYLLGVQEMARSGYEDTSKELGELSLLAQSAGDMTADNANNYLLATDAAYKYCGSVEKLNAALDGANYISNKNSASLTDIADATRVSASFAANAGVAIDELTAAEATMIATTKRSGSEIGRAFRSIVLNLQQVSGEFDGEVIDEEQLKEVEARCHSLGVELEYMQNGIATLRNPMEILKDLADVYNSLPDNSAEKQGLISDLGGKYHANALSSLLARWDLYEKMLSEFSQGTGSALEEAEKTANSWEGRLNSLQNSWDSFINSLTNKTAITSGISFFDRLIQGAESLTDTIGEIPVVLTAVNSAMVAMNKDYGITQVWDKDKGKVDIQGNIFGIDFTTIKSQKKHFEDASIAISDWNCELAAGKTDLELFENALIKNNAQLRNYLSACSKEAPASLSGYKAHLNAAGISTDALRLKTVLLNSAISMGIGIAIQAAVQGITYLIQKEENLRQATEEAANAYKESASSIGDYTSRYQELHKALLAAKGNEEETYSVKKQLLELQTELNDKFADEYGAINLVTDAYKDQTEAIKALNKETAQAFLNENKKGIDKAEKAMTKGRHYNLSLTGISAYTDEGAVLKEIAEKYKGQGVSLMDELGDGSYSQFSIHIDADAQSAYDTINAFENDLRGRAKELGDEHMFDDVLDVSSASLNKAKETIDKYGDIFRQALTAEIASDDGLSSTYNEVLKSVDAYNEAVLRSENIYDDGNVAKAKEGLDAVKDSIQGNETEWGRYAALVDEVFSQADTRLLEFNEAMQNNAGLQNLANELKEYSDLDLKAFDNTGDNVSFEKLKESAGGYNVSVDELIDSLVRLGYVQGKITSETSAGMDEPKWGFSQTIDQLNTQLKPAFDSLKSAYQDIFTDDGFMPENVDLSMLDSIKSKLDELNELEGANISIDYSSFDNLVRVLTDSSSKSWEVQKAFDSLATSVLNSTDVMDSMDESTVQLVASMLESMGVVNANEVAYEAFNAKMEGLALQEQLLAETGKELANVTADDAAAFLNHAGASEVAKTYLFQLVAAEQVFNAQGLDVSGKIEKLKELATAYGQTAIAAKIAHMEDQNAKAHTSFTDSDYQMLIDEVNNAVNNVQVDFGNIGSGSKSAGSAGKEAADAYLEAFEKELKDLDDLKDRGKITEKQYLDALRRLYLKYFRDKEKYLKEYEKYEHQYLEGMKSLYESAFSYITKQIDKRIDATNAEKDATVSALEAERDARLEAIEAQKEQLENEIEGIEKEIEAKEKEIKAMQDANEERKRSLDLQKAEYDLQRMQNQKTSLVYKDGQVSYEADTSGIRDAKQEVEDAKLEIDISKIEKEIGLLEEQKDLLQEQIDLLDQEADRVNDYYDKLIAGTEKQYDAMVKGMEQYKSQFEELLELSENARLEATLSELGINMDALLNGSQEEFEKMKGAYIGILADMSRGNEEMIGQLSRLAGVNAESVSYLESTKSAFENFGAVTLEGLGGSVEDIRESVSGLATSAGEASSAVGIIQEGIDRTSGSITPLNVELEKLNSLIMGLTSLLNNIIFPEIGDDEYAQKLRDIASAFGEIAVKCAEFQQIDFGSIVGSGAVMTAGNGDPLSGGSASDTQGKPGTGFMGLASAILSAVSSISEQMGILESALQRGNDAFTEQIRVITEEYIPAWVDLQKRLAEIIGVGGGDDKNGNKPSDSNGESEASDGSIIGTIESGGIEVAKKLKDPWLKAFNDFATDGDNSIQTICDKIIGLVTEMARVIQEKCKAAAAALDTLASKAASSPATKGGGGRSRGGYKGTVGDAFAGGTTKIESLPITGYKGIPHDEKNALRSEYGQPELTVYPDGTAELTTEPVISDLPKGTVIFNEEQTRRIMSNKGEMLETYADGTVRRMDGSMVKPDGEVIYPITPDDRLYWMQKKFEGYFRENKGAFIKPAHAMLKTAGPVDKAVEMVNHSNTMNRTEIAIGDIHLHEVQDADRLSDELILRLPNKILQKMHKV